MYGIKKIFNRWKNNDIYQQSTDRIVSIDIANKDEMGFDSVYTLVVEIMARHSNISLVRKR